MSEVAQYVGVAATSSPDEIRHLQVILDAVNWPGHIRFMNGPLVSRKTLNGLSPDNQAQYPLLKQVAEVLVDDPRFFNVVHFNSRDPRLSRQMEQIVRLTPNMHGIQLNILWPDTDELAKFRQNHPEIKIILQVSRFSLESVGNDTRCLIECLKKYEALIDYGLFDPSGGEGKSYDRSQASALLGSLIDSKLPIHWGVTGGLCADRIWGLKELLNMYPQLCWDAQSRLRDEHDQLDLEKCYGFLAASIALLK